MKLVIDMSALSVDKRKMVVDYLQDNEVPITWAGNVNPQMDIYAEVAKELNSLPTAPLKNWGTPDRFVGKHPALAAPYTSSIPPEVFDDFIEAVCQGAEQAGIPRRLLGFDLAEGRDRTATAEEEAYLVELLRRSPKFMTEEDFREQYMCDFKPDPKAWIPHHGGPCPVSHDEVEVELRGDHRPGKDVETRSVKRRGMPESFIWQWGRLQDPTSRNDVLNWRPALPKAPTPCRECDHLLLHFPSCPVMRNTQEWADAEVRRQEGLEPQVKTVREDLIAWLVQQCNLTLEELASGSNAELVALGKKYRRTPGQWLKLADTPALHREAHVFRRSNEVSQFCFGSAMKHRWTPTEFMHLSEARPILRCVHCNVRIYGPYNELPAHLRNEDDPAAAR